MYPGTEDSNSFPTLTVPRYFFAFLLTSFFLKNLFYLFFPSLSGTSFVSLPCVLACQVSLGCLSSPILTALPNHLDCVNPSITLSGIIPDPILTVWSLGEDNIAVWTKKGNDKNLGLLGGDAMSLDQTFLTFRKTVVSSKFRELAREPNLTSREDFTSNFQLCQC